MNDFIQQEWFGNKVQTYLLVLAVILFAWILRRIISRYFAGLIYSIVHRVWKDVDKRSFTSLVIRPLGLFLAIFVSIVALYRLQFADELNTEIYKYNARQIIQCLGNIILIVSFTNLLVRIIDFVALILEKRADLTPEQTDNQLIVFFKDFFKVIFVIVGIMLVLRYAFGLNIGGLLTGLSIVGAAIALALRESLENLIASFIIFFDKPFTLGDIVKVHNVTGSVERIGLRSTRIRTDQKTFVTVPNKQMVDSILDNLSLRTQRKGEIQLDLEKDTRHEKVEAILQGMRKAMQRKEIEDSQVFLLEITANAVVIHADYFTAAVTTREFNELKEQVNLYALELLEEKEVVLAGTNTIRLVKEH
jgi:MscS family membrane protein